MAKKEIFNYRAYLKILGAVTMVMGFLGVITAISIIITKIPVDQLGISNLDELRKIEGSSDDMIRAIIAVVAGIAALWTVFEGWLMRRAAKTPEKSTFLLVLLVISVVSGFVSVVSGSAGNGIAAVISTVINLILNILALMSVFSLRKEVAEK